MVQNTASSPTPSGTSNSSDSSTTQKKEENSSPTVVELEEINSSTEVTVTTEMEKKNISTSAPYAKWRYLRILNDIRPLKPVITRLVVCAVYYGICLYIMSIMAVVSGIRYPKVNLDLPDLGFEIIPVMDKQQTTIPNSMLLVGLLGGVLRCVLHDKGITIIRRFLVIHGTTALIRCICLVATSYPDPNRLCIGYQAPDTAALFWQETIIHTGFLTCGDLMFSGHTLVYILIAMLWQKYCGKYEKIFVWLLMLFACFSLVATRMHYTDDVLIAFYIAVTAWWFYHYAAQPHIRKDIFIINWLESEFIEEEVRTENEDLLHRNNDSEGRGPPEEIVIL